MVTACVCFIFKDFIFDVIIFGPKKLSFPTYKFLCNAATFVNIETHFCGEEFPFRIQSRTWLDSFLLIFGLQLLAGFIISFPYVIYEFWKFISPGLS